jgi:hypothetical protein
LQKQLLSSDGVSVNPRAVDNAARFIRDYLSLEQFEDIEGTCPHDMLPNMFSYVLEHIPLRFIPST